MMWKRALVSVSDKTGLADFLKPLSAKGLVIVSTGGTAQYLKDNGLAVVDVSEVTGFPEVLDGRVKTLHPHIHMGLLAKADSPEHSRVLSQFEVERFDLVIVNLYPFEQALASGKTGDTLIEQIDVGGPTMLRAAAKNHKSITVICDPKDYAWIGESMTNWDKANNLKLAAKVFAHTASYDAMIANALCEDHGGPILQSAREHQSLRYGENPQQQAKWLVSPGVNWGWQQAQILQGKELSYNNLLDLESALQTLLAFDLPACVAVKHNNPCGIAEANQLTVAVRKAIQADPVSVFGGIIAINREVTESEAGLLSEVFLECIVAPRFSDSARQIFSKKKNLRLLEWSDLLRGKTLKNNFSMRAISGGFLQQQQDLSFAQTENWKFLGEVPNQQILSDLIFAEKCAAFLKSNSIAIVEGGQTLGLGMGQVNRVDAVQQALQRMQEHHRNAKVAVLASDAFFPFKDSIELIAKAGVQWVLQPGGSLKDEEVFQAAKSLGVNMVITGARHFRH